MKFRIWNFLGLWNYKLLIYRIKLRMRYDQRWFYLVRRINCLILISNRLCWLVLLEIWFRKKLVICKVLLKIYLGRIVDRVRLMNIIFRLMICLIRSCLFLIVRNMFSRLNPCIMSSLKSVSLKIKHSFRKIHFMTLSLIIVSLDNQFKIKFSIILGQVLSIKVIYIIKRRYHKVIWINHDFLSLNPGCLVD